MIRFSSGGGISRQYVLGLAGVSFRWAMMIFIGLSPVNGSSPENIS